MVVGTTGNAAGSADLMKAIVIDTRDGFKELRADWDRLLRDSNCSSVFMTWEWLFTWWLTFGDSYELTIVVVYGPEGKLVGLGPFCIAPAAGVLRVRRLQFLGASPISSEYLDVIAAQGMESTVVEKIFSFLLLNRIGWDFISLSDMLPESNVLKYYSRIAELKSLIVMSTMAQSCPYLDLPAQNSLLEGNMSPQARAQLRRKLRRIMEKGASVEKIETSNEASYALLTLVRLHSLCWGQRGQSGNFQQIRVRRFHQQVARELCEKGWMTIYILMLEKVPLACLYGFKYQSKYFYYQAGFNPAIPAGLSSSTYSPGMVLMYEVLQDLIRNGVRRFDFLRGEEDYKRHWTSQSVKTRTLILIPKSNYRAQTQNRLQFCSSAAKKFVKRVLLLISEGMNRKGAKKES